MAVVTLITLFATRRGRDLPIVTGSADPIAEDGAPSHMIGMEDQPTRPRKQHPVLRQVFFVLGILLIIASPLVGAIPGPGGVVVFAAGLALALKNSEWAKRKYVQFKRAHPNKGRWADWGMRRPSARRREAMRRDGALEQGPDSGEAEAGLDQAPGSGRTNIRY